MKIVLDASKSAQANATAFFEKAKRLKQKIAGAREGLRLVEEKRALLDKKSVVEQKPKPLIRRKVDWYEKFHWCLTSNGLLIVGGRDAHSNEVLVKRHMEEKDLYFHADTHGAPHCLLKEGRLRAQEGDIREAASFAGLYSSIWKKGLFSVKVYSVYPEQVSKKAPAGESLGKGAFMIYGQRHWHTPLLRMGMGVHPSSHGPRMMGGPLTAVQTHAHHIMEILPGEKSKSEVAKSYLAFLRKKWDGILPPLDDIIRTLPNGLLSMRPVEN
ncbi:MAG: NFACT RNA binding domain-containing protein [Candidatus Diapherotrites archaeon]|nr:NFACT RNA binding domain-containing protein [Candidatus Diapherotrites archaeon]MDZ4256603.1 NFACT RNA binding domain-containing protein [archaeon]